jgi:hypothetical protein
MLQKVVPTHNFGMRYGVHQDPVGVVRPFTPTERASIDALLGTALVDQAVHERLVYERDTAFLTANGLSLPVQRWLKSLAVNSLVEIAQAVTYHP